jgi:hypothetical protein
MTLPKASVLDCTGEVTGETTAFDFDFDFDFGGVVVLAGSGSTLPKRSAKLITLPKAALEEETTLDKSEALRTTSFRPEDTRSLTSWPMVKGEVFLSSNSSWYLFNVLDPIPDPKLVCALERRMPPPWPPPLLSSLSEGGDRPELALGTLTRMLFFSFFFLLLRSSSSLENSMSDNVSGSLRTGSLAFFFFDYFDFFRYLSARLVADTLIFLVGALSLEERIHAGGSSSSSSSSFFFFFLFLFFLVGMSKFMAQGSSTAFFLVVELNTEAKPPDMSKSAESSISNDCPEESKDISKAIGGRLFLFCG